MNKSSSRYTTSCIFEALSLIILTVISITAYQGANLAMAYPQGYDKEEFSFGTISSIQDDESGNPTWLVSGHWKSNLLSNESRILDQENKTYSGSSFDSQVEMVRLNGTAQHTHAITNFKLTNSSQPNNITEVFNGTSTASLREGPVTDIPTNIKIMGDRVISIWLDPVKVKNHFGDTPIYGLIMEKQSGTQMYTRPNNTQTGNSSMGR